MGMLTKRTGGISIVGGDEEMFKGDRTGNIELLGDGVCCGNQGSACAGRGRVVHPGVATLEGRVFGDEERDIKVAVEVKEGELMIFKWSCEWEERTEGKRWRGGVSYNPLGWTSHVSTPAWLSRSLLRLSIPSIRSGTCMPMGNHGGARSS